MRHIKIVLGFLLFVPAVVSVQASTERSASTWDLVRQEMTKKAEPNKPVQPVRVEGVSPSFRGQDARETIQKKPAEPAKMQQVETPTGERVLHFPKDRSIGQLLIQDEGADGEIKSFFYWTEGGRNWESFAQAQGDIVAPAGKRLSLNISKADTSSLSALSKLNSDDLYRLVISGSYPSEPTRRPVRDDRCIAYIKHLTSLKIYNL